MQQSVPSPTVVQATFAATLVDEWCRMGLQDAVVAPGSRSTPLVLALAREPALGVHVRLDERSAAFFALGRALATRRPVLVVVTSGTAAAELHAAVAEADLAGVPLIVATADRPPELHNVGAPQTMDQRHLYGAKSRLYEEPGVARWEARETWRELAARLYAVADGRRGPRGPVHLNAAFVEPLVSEAAELPEPRAERAWLEHRGPSVLSSALASVDRGLCIVGAGVDVQTVRAMSEGGWAVLGDATTRGTIAHGDALLRDEHFATSMRPDVVVRIGGIPASKVLAQRLVEWAAPVVAFDGAGPVADPDRVVTSVVAGLPAPETLSGESDYARRWRRASRGVAAWLAKNVDEGALDEPSVARAVVVASTRHAVPLVVGSSMPVRDVEWWAPTRESPTFANRGVNGIDGVTSTILGVGVGARVIGYVGDVTFLHDVSALVDGLGESSGSAVLVVADNHGGGIFNFLAQSREPEALFERFFGTPRAHDAVALARAFGHFAQRVTSRQDLDTAIDDALAREGISVVVADVPSRALNVARHDELNVAAAATLESR